MPSLGRETLVIFAGRGVNLALSMAGLFIYPVILGPQAHGVLQYCLGMYLFLLGFLNGCAAPMMAHFIAIYRVSDPPRQWPFILQVLRWFVLLLFSLLALYPFLEDKSGFFWIFVAVAMAGLAQLLANAEYGLGHLGPTTWFPAYMLLLRLLLVAGAVIFLLPEADNAQLLAWSKTWIPILFVISSIPSLAWVLFSFQRRTPSWRTETAAPRERVSLFPWKEIRSLGLASLIGQLVFQLFTRSLAPLAGQMKFPEEQVGYLGLAIQGFGLVVYLAGIFSVSSYPWLVSAGEAGEEERFRILQSESWRLSALLGGILLAAIFALTRPLIWLALGEEYHRDIDLIVRLIWIGAISGGFMLAAEFHLRMLISLTQMTRYLWAILLGFTAAIPVILYVVLYGSGIVMFALILASGVGGLMVFSIYFAPRTAGFYAATAKALGGVLAGCLAVWALPESNWAELALKGFLLTAVYLGFAWLSGLFIPEDLRIVRRLWAKTEPSADFS